MSERFFQMKASGMIRKIDDRKAARKVLEAMIDEKLIVQFGKEKEIEVTDREIQESIDNTRNRMGLSMNEFKVLLRREGLALERYREMLRDQILAQKVLSIEVRSQVQISDKAVEEYYDKHRELFATPVKVEARHIVFRLGKEATQRETGEVLKRIKEIRKEIINGLDFSDAARKYSQGPSASNGGKLGMISPGQMVESFEEAVFSLKPGKVCRPVRTVFGYHLILVDKKTKSRLLPFEDVGEKVKERMYMEILSEVRAEWLKMIKRDAFIDIKVKSK